MLIKDLRRYTNAYALTKSFFFSVSTKHFCYLHLECQYMFVKEIYCLWTFMYFGPFYSFPFTYFALNRAITTHGCFIDAFHVWGLSYKWVQCAHCLCIFIVVQYSATASCVREAAIMPPWTVTSLPGNQGALGRVSHTRNDTATKCSFAVISDNLI